MTLRQLSVLFFALTVIACRKTSVLHSAVSATPDTLVAGTFITSAGTFTHHDGNTTRELTISPAGSNVAYNIRYTERIGRGSSGGSSGSSISLSSPGDPWFIFVESPQRLWIFDGADELFYNFREPGGGQGGPAIHAGKLHKGSPPVPRDLVARLPAELRQLFQHGEAPGKRPSL